LEADFQKINHNYITRVIIYAILLYQEQRDNHQVYTNLVQKFVLKRLRFKVEIKIDLGKDYNIEERRDILLDQLLENDQLDKFKTIGVKFKTGLKEMNLIVDLRREKEYEKYLMN
jgi:hypothetical protein